MNESRKPKGPEHDDRESAKTLTERADHLLDDNQVVHYRLNELVAGITDDNRHDVIDFGEPVGREAW